MGGGGLVAPPSFPVLPPAAPPVRKRSRVEVPTLFHSFIYNSRSPVCGCESPSSGAVERRQDGCRCWRTNEFSLEERNRLIRTFSKKCPELMSTSSLSSSRLKPNTLHSLFVEVRNHFLTLTRAPTKRKKNAQMWHLMYKIPPGKSLK